MRPGGHREQLAALLGNLAATDNDRKIDSQDLVAILKDRFAAQVQSPYSAPRELSIPVAGTPYQVIYRRTAADKKVKVWFLDITNQVTTFDLRDVQLELTGQPPIKLTKQGSGFEASHSLLESEKALVGKITFKAKDKLQVCPLVEFEVLSQAMPIPKTDKKYRLLYKRTAWDKKVRVWMVDSLNQLKMADLTEVTLELAGLPALKLVKEGSAFASTAPALGENKVLTGTLSVKVIYNGVVEDKLPLAEREKDDVLVLDLAATKNPAWRVTYQRNAAQKKVIIGFLKADSNEPATPGVSKMSLKLTNVEGQPRIDLTQEGSVFTGTDEAFGKDKVLAGIITLAVGNKDEHCYFIEREPLEHRQAIANLLFAVSKVLKPDGKSLLEALTDQRVEKVIGRERYNQALILQTMALKQIAQRRALEIDRDREFFIDAYTQEINQQIPYLIYAIERQKRVKKEWDKQLEEQDNLLAARQKFHQLILEQVQVERGLATDALLKVREWQDELFKALQRGAGVAEENQRLERKIRQMERSIEKR
jgi:hypothetical protein